MASKTNYHEYAKLSYAINKFMKEILFVQWWTREQLGVSSSVAFI